MTTLPRDTAPAALALAGGTPVRTGPLPPWPHYDEDEITAATEVLVSGRVNYWTGTHGRAFEAEFAGWAGAGHAVAVANGTVALELALRAIGIERGDEVVVPAATFVATASAVAACGAIPIVADVDEITQGLSAATVEPRLTARTAAVVVVHVGGYPADTAGLVALTERYGLALVEDCAQAHGARRDGVPVGRSGVVAAWSFCQDKIMSTGGEGGAITTSDPAIARRCWELKDHGKSFVRANEPAPVPGFRYLHDSFGTNARMTEMQAAIGRIQIRKLPAWVERRRRNAAVLRDTLALEPAVTVPPVPDDVLHAYYRFYAHVRPERLRPGWDRERIVAAINAEGVRCAHGGCTEIYRERAFEEVGRPEGELPVGARLGRTSFVLPVHPTLDARDVADVAEAARRVLREARA
ncbi:MULTISPECIES: DegT/DnrJ/EryC1/StrS family aminotransferase [Pseudonocardia]|uniref:dTDP-3-amino-3,6-dideoxy-alpha-D-galactopyranose transaminase n=2 Tax=Pseudonocardia TaxID=1847 RepID=A0A1Y2N889_PSEAH|nr:MULTISPECIES: DegT/DnrJ/EryC1/StrS aminotransferase family protein [Pseudonocardia]OSY43663.1 dTDP-3-amino-3,6-dideoxy-alpha-D-galactopyranose transaminase [Pseudonocardia autotrophica]TDN73347.1 dTDP-4-amino-4,6-dideoxygalactose transaminase [Pseudonocardia autotrophica]BBG04085.1 aminotransferase [Pseudonocardia autotrophica]GEC26222.1 aminotransferase [Pseudonocardia saturnea]